MLRLATDEDFNNRILRGLLRRLPDLDVARVQDVGLSGSEDPDVLEWAAGEGRVLLTHDASTMSAFAYERVKQGLAMPGIFEISQDMPIGQAIEEIVMIAMASLKAEYEGQVRHLPLR
jgi:predicted nuclease of predicted toxin-antitoxin system